MRHEDVVQRIGRANGDEQLRSVAIATSAAAHPRGSPCWLPSKEKVMNGNYFKHTGPSMHFAAGASASINKTISEIEAIVGGKNLGHGSPKRAQLRAKLKNAVMRSSKSWYKKGFMRGHRESYHAHKLSGRVPRTLSVQVEREFIPNSPSIVSLKSKIRSKRK